MLRKFELLLDAGEQISITKMARDLTHDNTPSDGFLVLIGDAVKRVVEDYGFEIVDDYISNSNLIPRLGRVFINESQLVHRWEECKRLGCWVEEKNNVSIFLHPNSDYLISAAVALDHRHHDEAQIWNIVSQVSRLHANRRPREGVPVVSRASMDVWARLLVNGGDTESGVEIRRAFVSVLAEMTALDVRNLAAIEQVSPADLSGASLGVWTSQLPDLAMPISRREAGVYDKSPSAAVLTSLSNLERLGCIYSGNQFERMNGSSPLRAVGLTPFGQAFVQACTFQREP